MKITRDNYEEWALDFLEGNLGAGELAAFEDFLAHNDDIAETIRGMLPELPVVKAEQVVFTDKQSLYKGRHSTEKLRRIRSFLSGIAAAVVLLGIFFTTQHLLKNEDKTVMSHDNHENNCVLTKNTAKSDIFAQGNVEDNADGVSTLSAETLVVTNVSATKTVKADKACEPATVPAMELPGPLLDGGYSSVSTEKSLNTDRNLFVNMDFTTPEEPEPTFGGTLKQSFASILAPFDEINPLKIYRTENERGIEIAFIRIGRNIKQTDEYE